MPVTDIECPNCGGVLHTDDLLERECVTSGCGHELPSSLYDDARDFYTPQSVVEEAQ